MHVRTLEDDDLEAAMGLWAATEHLGPPPTDDLDRLRSMTPQLVLVAESGGAVVGVVLGGDDGRRGWISRLAVAASHRRRGVARALVAELEQRLAAAGCQQVNLLVYGHNDEGRALWEELGYEGSDGIAMYRRRLDDATDGGC